MPSFPLPRFLAQHAQHRDHARELTGSVTSQNTNLKKRVQYVDPADTLTLRGIPAIGRGVAGVIRYTQPELAVVASSERSVSSPKGTRQLYGDSSRWLGRRPPQNQASL